MNLDLTKYLQTIDVVDLTDTYNQVPFNNLSPLLLLNDRAVGVLRQGGRAIAWFHAMKAPDPIPASPIFLEKPKVVYRKVEEQPWTWETTWEYVMAVDSTFLASFGAAAQIAAQAWPANPVMLNV